MGAIAEYLKRSIEKDVREQGLLIWLDKDNEYGTLVNQWTQDDTTLSYPIYSYQGSYLELMVKSRAILSSTDSPKAIIHMPGFNEENIRHTPVFEAYKAGNRWRKSLVTAIRETAQGKLTEDQTSHLLKQSDLCLELAESFIQEEQDVPQEVQNLINRLGEDGFFNQFISNPREINEQLFVAVEHRFPLILDYFKRLVGLDQEWIQEWNPNFNPEQPEDQAESLIAYLMCLEFIDDLNVEPPTPPLERISKKQKEFHKKADYLLQQLRESNSELYIKWADRVEANLSFDISSIQPENLGRVDTFKFEADAFVRNAMIHLESSNWTEALALAETRLPGRKKGSLAHTFWLKNDRNRLWLWEWIEVSAKLGSESEKLHLTLNQLKTKNLDLDNLRDAYTDSWYKLDQLHRNFSIISERNNTNNTTSQFKEFVDIRKNLRLLHRSVIDEQSNLWNKTCKQKGFLGDALSQQRNFYKNYIQPHVENSNKTAIIFADALRYELAQELIDILDLPGSKLTQYNMLSELPSITSIGMNALVPSVQGGLLEPIFDVQKGSFVGIQSGQRKVKSPDDRRKVLEEVSSRSVGWVNLNEFLDKSDRSLRSQLDSEILCISALDIDKMGESGAMAVGINYFKTGVARLKSAIHKLKDKGFSEIVITSDHGFLIGDESLQTGRGAKLTKADRRYAVDIERQGGNLVSASFLELKYQGMPSDKALVFDQETHLLINNSGTSFYHGGNTLQERIVPVINISSSKKTIQTTQKKNAVREEYEVSIEQMHSIMGLQRLSLKVGSGFTGQLFSKPKIDIQLKSIEAGVIVEIQDVPDGSHTGDIITAPMNESVEVIFKLTSNNISKSQISCEAIQSDHLIKVISQNSFYDVIIDKAMTPSSKSQPQGFSIDESIPMEFHVALQHLHKHKSLTEKFLMNSLGADNIAARKARRFANNIQGWATLLPFDITVELTNEGKTYRIEGN